MSTYGMLGTVGAKSYLVNQTIFTLGNYYLKDS